MESMYYKIQNPLEDPNIMMKVFESYSKSTDGRSFYDELLNIKQKNEIYKKDDFERFFVYMFYSWRDRLIDYSNSRNGNPGFSRLIYYLEHCGYLRTKSEVDRFLRGNKVEKSANPYRDVDVFNLSSLRWDSKSENRKWYSCNGVSANDVLNNMEHILFVNVKRDKMYEFAQKFVEVCDKKNTPYNFKFMNYDERDDFFQIFSDSEHLNKFINIIQRIRNYNPDLFDFEKELPLLSGKIDTCISYGSVEIDDTGLPNLDYFQSRTNIIATAINKSTVDYIKEHKKRKLDYHGMELPLYEFLALRAKDKYINALTKKYIEISEKDGEKQAKKIIGYSFEEIKSIPFSANVYTLMMKNMEKNLIAIGKSKGEFKSLEININSPVYLCDVLKELSPYLYQMDKNYRLEFNGFLYAESFNSKYEPFNFAVSQNSKDIRTLVYTDKNERGIFR